MPNGPSSIARDIQRDLEALVGTAKVGIFPEAGQTTGADDSKSESAQHLAWSDLGTPTEPPRPTLTQAYDENEPRLGSALDAGISAVLDTGGGATAALTPAAAVVRDETVRRIDANLPPPLAASTVASRLSRGNNSTRTLVDTGSMRAAVDLTVKEGR